MNLQKIKDFIITNKYILGILVLGLILRLYNYKELFMYGHDQDLQGWFIKDVVENKHLRLIGQETSTQGIFIGALFYYLLIPFYLLFKMDPIGGVFMSAILGLFTIWSFYFVLLKIFSRQTGLIGAFVYSISYYTVFNDREVVPTMPVILWTVWFLWGLYLTFKGQAFKGLLLIGFLAGLTWHLNMALAIALPLTIVAMFYSLKKLRLKSIFFGVGVFVITSAPLLLFELRHGYSQGRHLVSSLTTNQHDIVSGVEKIKRTYHLLSKDFAGVIWGDYFELRYEYTLWLFVAVFILLVIKHKIRKEIVIIFSFWVVIYLVFFSLYSKILSEYYLNGTLVVFISVLALGISTVLQKKKYSDFAKAFLLLFTIVNLDRFITIPVNRSGYVEKNQILDSIQEDQLRRSYACVSISYITDPGYDKGYRYLMWLKGIKTKPVSEDIPVYTIVFPLKPIFETDKTYGAVGLVYPDYKKYNIDKVRLFCEGDDFNVTDPMIGFTQ